MVLVLLFGRNFKYCKETLAALLVLFITIIILINAFIWKSFHYAGVNKMNNVKNLFKAMKKYPLFHGPIGRFKVIRVIRVIVVSTCSLLYTMISSNYICRCLDVMNGCILCLAELVTILEIYTFHCLELSAMV